ncbi:MAG: RNA polymerase sigma factor [Chlorobi bacterium]|nr:RNA polymerase sigma factor [Chlorobiota bacterium]
MQLKRKITGKRISETELGKLIDQYQEPLLKHAFFITGSFQDAQDIVQETFVKFYRQCPASLEASKTKSYLYRMVNNAGIDHIRKRKGKWVDIQQIANIPEEKQNGSKWKTELHNEFLRIGKLLDQIPGEQAEVIRMRTISDLSFAEIARILELPVTTVKSRFAYGIDKLRKKTGLKKEVYDEL